MVRTAPNRLDISRGVLLAECDIKDTSWMSVKQLYRLDLRPINVRCRLAESQVAAVYLLDMSLKTYPLRLRPSKITNG